MSGVREEREQVEVERGTGQRAKGEGQKKLALTEGTEAQRFYQNFLRAKF